MFDFKKMERDQLKKISQKTGDAIKKRDRKSNLVTLLYIILAVVGLIFAIMEFVW